MSLSALIDSFTGVGMGGKQQMDIVQSLVNAVNAESRKYLFQLKEAAAEINAKRKTVDSVMDSVMWWVKEEPCYEWNGTRGQDARAV